MRFNEKSRFQLQIFTGAAEMKQPVFKLAKIAALVAVIASQSAGAAQQTWVSGLGNNTNNNSCSPTQPCQTIQYALSLTSPGGEVSILDGGTYEGFTITQSVTINAVGAIGTIQATAAGAAITVNAGSNDVVTLRGLSINGGRTVGTNGIVFNSGAKLQVENSAVFGFTGDGLYFKPSADSTLFVSNSTFRNNGAGGIWVAPTTGSADATFSGVRVEGNLRGIKVDDNSTVLIRNSVAASNLPGNGFGVFSLAAGGRTSVMTIENSTTTMNGNFGIVVNGPLSSLRMANVTSTDNGSNGIAVGVNGGTVYSFGGNRLKGNAGGEMSAGLVPTKIDLE